MEISSSFSFFDDCSSSFSFAQDCEPSVISFSNSKKRPRFDDDFDSDLSVHDLLTKFLAFDDSTDEKQVLKNQDAPQSSILMDSNCNSNVYSNSIDSGNSPQFKRARTDTDDSVTTTTSDDSSAAAIGGAQRRLWVKDRSNAWWEQVNSPNFPAHEFKKAFRMSRATFDMICDELETAIVKKDTMLRSAIPVRQRVAVCVWRLATGEALREVSKRFGLGISTCHKLVLEVCTAIRSVLMPKFLNWPDEKRTAEIKHDFESFSGIPNVAGAMYTTHIPIIAPKVSVAAYFNKRHTERNQKTSYSITVQGVVDQRGAFTDICIGYPGSMSDDQILEKSALSQRAKQGKMKDVNIVGNLGYPLQDWVLVPYSHQNLTWTQHAFNEKIEVVQRVAKESFMRLKARWKCLQKRTEMKLQDLPVVLGACCVLHNICEMRNEGLSEELRFEHFDDEMIAENSVASVNALQARDKIAHKLLHHSFAGTEFVL